MRLPMLLEMIDAHHKDNRLPLRFLIACSGIIMDRLEMMRCFVAVADHASFAEAARRLGLSTSSLTRHVAGLEAELQVQLFRRTTRAVSLTDDGARFLGRARGILADYDEAKATLESDTADLTGRLVVTAPVIFGRMHVAPLLAELAIRHSRLQIELQVSDRFESLVEDGIDVAFRIGEMPDSSDISIRVGSVRRVLVATPAYLGAAPPLAAPADLAAHRLIRFQALTPAGQWNFFPAAGPISLRPPVTFSTNSADVAIGLALDAAGLTFALSYQVFGHLKSGRLVRLLQDCEPPVMPISLVTSGSRQMSARLRVLLGLVRTAAAWDFALTA